MLDANMLAEADFKAADAILERAKSGPLAQEFLHDHLRHFYASVHASFGADKFALRFGLREPRTRPEELEMLFFGQQITEEEYRTRLRQYATRPVDAPMLHKFFQEYEAAIEKYGEVLQLIVAIATEQREPDAWRRREGEVDAAVLQLDGTFDLFSTELMTVFDYLTRVQASREEPIRCGDYIGDSAHWIAALAFSHTSKGWKHYIEIADRSRTDARYLYSTSASALFYTTWIESGKLPRPNDLAALMRSERAKALAQLNEKMIVQPARPAPARTVQPVHFEDFSGHQFERLVFAYHLRTEKWRTLEWYGQSGSDLGRDIWGERETGESLCIQCVNRKTAAAKKITRDLDKIVRAHGGIPATVLIVCASSVSATLRDKVRGHAQEKGIPRCVIWSGGEFEERLRKDAESLLKRFMDGESFPDDPDDLRRFAESKIVNDDGVGERIARRDTASTSLPAQSLSVVGSNNSGVIANQVTIRSTRPRPHTIILPNSIGSDPEKYNYVEYLIKRLTEFREAGASYGQHRAGRVHPGSTRKILERQLGGLPKDLPADRFADVCAHLQAKIDDTAQGRNNRKRGGRNYHRFEEHFGPKQR